MFRRQLQGADAGHLAKAAARKLTSAPRASVARSQAGRPTTYLSRASATRQTTLLSFGTKAVGFELSRLRFASIACQSVD